MTVEQAREITKDLMSNTQGRTSMALWQVAHWANVSPGAVKRFLAGGKSSSLTIERMVEFARRNR